MNAGDLLTPWLMLAAVLVPLVLVEQWIHSHLYGVGWLLTNDNRSATILYYVLLFPGVFVHEVVQWLAAGALRVDIKRIRVWPDVQKDGTLRLDFVQIKPTNKISTAIIGAAPFLVGLALVWVISNYILNLDALLAGLGARDPRQIGVAVRQLARTPDFYLWLYLLFAISNAMLPTPADRQGWALVLGLIAAAVVFLIAIGTGDQLLKTYRESVLSGVKHLTTAFATLLVVEIPAVFVIGLVEEVLERLTKRKFMYRNPRVSGKREPGSPDPLPAGEPKPSVYLLELPVPLPPERPKPRRGTGSGARTTAPEITAATADAGKAPVPRPRPASVTATQRLAPGGRETADSRSVRTDRSLATAAFPAFGAEDDVAPGLLGASDANASHPGERPLKSPLSPDRAVRERPFVPGSPLPRTASRSPAPYGSPTDSHVEPAGAAASRSDANAVAGPLRRAAPAEPTSDSGDENDYLGNFRQYARRDASDRATSSDGSHSLPGAVPDNASNRARGSGFFLPGGADPEAEEADLEYVPFDDVDAGDEIDVL